MSQIQMNLPEQITEYVGAQVASGRFPSVEEYLGALVQADQITQEMLSSLNGNPKLEQLLEEGLNSGSAGEWNAEALAKLKQQVFDRAAGNVNR
jgi:putative addiction module CopG family antidote